MAGVGFRDIQQAATQASDSDKLRLGRSDDRIKTAKHGFVSRLVRWIGGATRQDRADNKQLLGHLLSGLKKQYGDNIGTQAFLAARPLAYVDDRGDLIGATAKSLTARQVKNAIAFAEARQIQQSGANAGDSLVGGDHNQQFRASARSQADAFSPGTANFNDVARQAGIDPQSLSPEQKTYFQSRLREKVVGTAQKNGEQPSGSEVAALAGKLLKHTVNSVGADASNRLVQHGLARQAAERALNAFDTDNDDPAAALLELINTTDAIIADSAMTTNVGGWDTMTTRSNALDGAVGKVSKREAKARYDRLMEPNSTARKALFAAAVAADQVSYVYPFKATASADISQTIRIVVGALAVRAGADLRDINDLADSIDTDPMRGPKDHGIPTSALVKAGVTEAGDVADLVSKFDAVMGLRGKELERRDKANVQNY